MKKVIFTLNIDGYPHEITDLTYPLLQRYAEKIGAEFRIIRDRKFPDWPLTYEKIQIYELGRGYDWVIYFDGDALIFPDLFDVTAPLPRDTVLFNNKDFSPNRFKPDKYALRDGRFIGAGNWFSVCSDWCLDLWTPLDIGLEEAIGNIKTTVREHRAGIQPEHLIDDYTLTRNIAKFGLKHTIMPAILEKFERYIPNAFPPKVENYFWHQYVQSIDEKLVKMKEMMQKWGVL